MKKKEKKKEVVPNKNHTWKLIAVHSRQCSRVLSNGKHFQWSLHRSDRKREREREREREATLTGWQARLRWKIQGARARWKLEWTDSMHFDDKPLQQNSRGEYIAFVERAGRCPNGLRYFSAGSNKFDRRNTERGSNGPASVNLSLPLLSLSLSLSLTHSFSLCAFEIILRLSRAELSEADRSWDWSIAVTRQHDDPIRTVDALGKGVQLEDAFYTHGASRRDSALDSFQTVYALIARLVARLTKE